MTTCPYCEHSSSPVRRFQNRGSERLHLWRCPDCACEFLEPQPSDEWLKHEYAGYFSKRSGRVPATKSRLCQLILSKLTDLPSNAHILEIGGGEGHFVREVFASRQDISMTLVEPQADLSRLPSTGVTVRSMLVEEWLAKEPPRPFDAIVAMDLIEHLRAPTATFKELINSRLKPGGTIVITTPNAHSLSRALLGRVWPHYKVEHLTYPSESALRRLAENVGLSVVELSPLAKPLQIGYLVTVLRNFGPKPLRLLGSALDSVLPDSLRKKHARIPSGELLFVATKKSP